MGFLWYEQAIDSNLMIAKTAENFVNDQSQKYFLPGVIISPGWCLIDSIEGIIQPIWSLERVLGGSLGILWLCAEKTREVSVKFSPDCWIICAFLRVSVQHWRLVSLSNGRASKLKSLLMIDIYPCPWKVANWLKLSNNTSVSFIVLEKGQKVWRKANRCEGGLSW